MKRFHCPCCGYHTLTEQSALEICPVCFWEDDPYQSADVDCKWGANPTTLRVARANYLEYGASETRYLDCVRRPTPEELPPDGT